MGAKAAPPNARLRTTPNVEGGERWRTTKGSRKRLATSCVLRCWSSARRDRGRVSRTQRGGAHLAGGCRALRVSVGANLVSWFRLKSRELARRDAARAGVPPTSTSTMESGPRRGLAMASNHEVGWSVNGRCARPARQASPPAARPRPGIRRRHQDHLHLPGNEIDVGTGSVVRHEVDLPACACSEKQSGSAKGTSGRAGQN